MGLLIVSSSHCRTVIGDNIMSKRQEAPSKAKTIRELEEVLKLINDLVLKLPLTYPEIITELDSIHGKVESRIRSIKDEQNKTS